MRNKYLLKEIIIAIVLCTISIMLIPNVLAEGNTTTHVAVGTNTLQDAIKSASDGDTLILANGEYKGTPIKINKDITIIGNGRSTIIDPTIELDKKDDGTAPNITIENYSSPNYQKPNRHIYIDVKGKVNLTLRNIFIWQIFRDKDQEPEEQDVPIQIEQEASNSKITLDKCDVTGYFEAIRVLSSSTVLNIENESVITAQNSIEIISTDQVAENNEINVKNSTLNGRDRILKNHPETISINNQKNLTINLENTTIIGELMTDSNLNPTKIISFDGKTSTNVKINITGNSIIEDNTRLDNSVIFDFGESYDKENQIIVGKDVKFQKTTGLIEDVDSVKHKYNTSDDYVVVGIFDHLGNLTIKQYPKNQQISDKLMAVRTNALSDLGEENHKFKGWFKTKDYKDEFQEGDFVTENIDIYPLIVETVKVTINNQTYTLEKGQKLNDLTEKLEEIKGHLSTLKQNVVDAKGTFSGYYLSSGEEGQEFEETDLDSALNSLLEYPINATSTVAAIHNVTVTVKTDSGNKEFKNVKVGTTLEDLTSNEEFSTLMKKEGKHFKRFVESEKNTTFSLEEKIMENITIEPKFGSQITIEGNDTLYILEEGKNIEDDEEISTALENSKNKDKRFGRFVDQKNNEIKTNETISEDKVIKPIYLVKITVKHDTETIEEEIYLDENATLSELKGTNKTNFDEAMKTLKTKVEEDEQHFDPSEDDNLADSHGHIINKNSTHIYEDIVVVAIEKVKITIHSSKGDKTYTINAGEKLNDISTLVEDTQEKENRIFSRYVKNDGQTFKYDNGNSENSDVILRNLELTAKYNLTVTISRKEYYLEEDLTLDDLNEEGKAELEKFENVEGKGLDRYIYKNKEKSDEQKEVKLDEIASEKIKSNTEITPIYHVSISVEVGEDGAEGHTFIIDEGQTFKDIKEEDQEFYDNLKNKKDRHSFSRWVYKDEDENVYEFSETEPVLKNTTVYPKYNLTVTISGKEYYLEEGKTLSEDPTIMSALEESKDKSKTKQFDHFEDEKENVIDINKTPINDNITLEAKYTVTVTINDEEFSIPEGESLESFDDPDGKIDNALKALKDKTEEENHNFKGYIDEDGNEFTKSTPVSKNTTVKAKYNIMITIGTEEFEIDSGQTLSDIAPKDKNRFEDTKKKTERVFSRFTRKKDDTVETVDEKNTHFTENETITPIFSVTITVKGNPYYVEENETLDSNNKLMEALKEFEVSGKTVDGYTDGSGTPVDFTKPIDKNIEIKAVYSITVTINDYQGTEKGKVKLKEGQKLIDATDQKLLTDLEGDKTKTFVGYFADGEKINKSDKEFNTNTILVVKYTVDVTVKGITTDTITLEEGQTLKDGDQEKLAKIKTDMFSRFVDETSQNTIDEEKTKFTAHTTIIAKYNKTVTIDGQSFSLEEGLSLQDATEKGKEIVDNAVNKPNKKLKYFLDDKNTIINLDTPITEDSNLTSKYVINVNVNGIDYTLDEGQTLKDLESQGYEKPEGFKRFEDIEGNSIDEEKELHENTTLIAVYDIKVVINGKEYTLEAGQKLSDILKDNKDLKELKTVPDDKKSFSRFIFINSDGKVIDLNDDTLITSSGTIEARFNVEIVIEYTDKSGKKKELYTTLLEEGKTLQDLSKEELDNLNKALRKREEQLEKEGKHNFKFSKFLNIDGSIIDQKTTIFNTNSNIEAVFEYKSEPTQITPNEQTSNNIDNKDNTSNNNNYPVKVKVPETGLEREEDFTVLYLIGLIITLIITTFKYYKVIENK